VELNREILGKDHRILLFLVTLLKVPDTEGKENFLQKFMNLNVNYLLLDYPEFYTDVNSNLNLN